MQTLNECYNADHDTTQNGEAANKQLQHHHPIQQPQHQSLQLQSESASAALQSNIKRWHQTHKQLQLRITATQRESSLLHFVDTHRNCFHCSTLEFNQLTELQRLEAVFQQSCNEEQQQLWRSVHNIRSAIKQFSHTLALTQNHHHAAMQLQLQTEFNDIENQLSTFKRQQKQRYVDMTTEQSRLDSECRQMELCVEQWINDEEEERQQQQQQLHSQLQQNKHSNGKHTKQHLNRCEQQSTSLSYLQHSLQSQLEEIQQHLNKHHVNNQWHKDDEAAFMRIVNPLKIKVKADKATSQQADSDNSLKALSQLLHHAAILDKLCIEIPTQSRVNIKAHIDCFIEELKLQAYKKQILCQWKQMKQQQQDEKLEQQSNSQLQTSHSDSEAVTQTQCAAAAAGAAERRRVEQRLAVEAWRAQKARERQQQLFDSEAKQEAEQQRQLKFQNERLRLKLKLEQHHQQQRLQQFQHEAEQREKLESQTEQVKHKQRQIKQRLSIQRQLELDNAKAKFALQKQQAEQAERRRQRLEQQSTEQVIASMNVECSRQRLTSLTESELRRRKEREAELDSLVQQLTMTGKPKFNPQLPINMPHKAVPTWRQQH